MSDKPASALIPPVLSRVVHRSAVPIVLFWLGLTVILNTVVPQLEVVGRAHTVSLTPAEAPSMQAMKRIGQVFHEFDTDSALMIVIEGDNPLGDGAHRFYDELIRQLSQDKKHVEYIQDFWGDPLTAAGAQSSDGKA
ncbi:MAG: MMPL family transporter, partial [Mycobacterium sp.]